MCSGSVVAVIIHLHCLGKSFSYPSMIKVGACLERSASSPEFKVGREKEGDVNIHEISA